VLTPEKRKCIEDCLKKGMTQKDTAHKCKASLRDINKISKQLERRAQGDVELSDEKELIKLLWPLFRQKTPPDRISELYGIHPDVVTEYQRVWDKQVLDNPYLTEIEFRTEQKYADEFVRLKWEIERREHELEDLKRKKFYIDEYGGVHMEPPWLRKIVEHSIGSRISWFIIKRFQENGQAKLEDIVEGVLWGLPEKTAREKLDDLIQMGVIIKADHQTFKLRDA